MEEPVYVFVESKEDMHSVKNISLKSPIFVLWDNSMEPYFKGCKYILLSDSTRKIDLDIVKEKVLEFTKSFPHEKILDNKTLVELLEYRGYSLWWFVRQGLYEHFLRVVREITIIRALTKEHEIKKILVATANKEFISIVKEACKKTPAKLSIIKKKDVAFYPALLKRLFFGSIPRLIRTFQGFSRSNIPMRKNKKNVLLFTQDWTNLSENIKGDHNSYTIFRDLLRKNKYNVLPLDVVINKNAQWKSIREKKKPFIPYDYFIFKSYFDPETRKNMGRCRKKLSALWNALERGNSLKKLLQYDGIDLCGILKPRIRTYFFGKFYSFLGAARNVETASKIINDYGIDISICIDENGHSRFLVFASHMRSIPSIGLQHGIIYPFNISYNYGKKDISCYKNNLNCILADKTAVFGSKAKNLLLKYGNYSEKQLEVTGQPRTDIFIESRRQYSKKEMCKKLGIDSGKKLVVYASQPFEDMSEQKIALTEVIESLKGLDAELVVKMHPDDDSSFYDNLLSELGSDAVATKEADLYTLLFCSDLVISISSTVMLEALIMDKPVIQLNLLENYAFFEDLEGRVFTKVTRKKDLGKAVMNSLRSMATFRKMERQRKKFISEYYYKVDGKSTERFIKVMDGLIVKK
jgi:hypothetical protein